MQNRLGSVLFRPARKEECRTIARLYSISSDGLSDYIWTSLAGPGEDILDVGERRYSNEDLLFSYKNCMVAEYEGEIRMLSHSRMICLESGPRCRDRPCPRPYN
jgi:hypothetical protein